MRNGLVRLSRTALCVAACFGGVAGSAAAPALPKVVAGQATFSQDGNVFSITNTPGTIINWQSFSVNAGEIARFIQQGSDSAVLNRIVGQDPSRILGALQSNGKVFLINPNGVVFGQGARVDVNGLVASTLDIGDADFRAGRNRFTAGPRAGNIRNEGAITTPGGGQVFLVAPQVENSGIISAPNGDVVLAAGRSVQLVDAANPELSIMVSASGDQAVNLGQVVAQGGRIGIYGALVRQRGVLDADSAVRGRDGRIVLKASRESVLEAGSVTSANGSSKGGEIQLLGERVSLTGNARVDASGGAQGGTVLVGGDYQGKNAALPNAQQTALGKDAVIRADATVNGDGGKVVLWSDGATAAHGSISARGAGAGKGGLVETSGRRLELEGVRVDAGSAAGAARGSWLIDPANIVVGEVGKQADTTYIKADALAATDADIVLQATDNLSFLENLTTAHNLRAEAGKELTVGAALTSTAGSIDLRAKEHIKLLGGGLLASPDTIDLKAERMTLAGMIDGVGGTLPVLSLDTFDSGTGIVVGGGENGALTLAPGRLAAFRTFSLNIGNSGHTGDVTIDAPLRLDGNLVIDTAGRVRVNAPVVLDGTATQFFAQLHAGGPFEVGSAGRIDAGRRIGIAGAGRVAIGGALTAGEIAIEAGSGGMALTADITTGSGDINLAARSPLNIGGRISTDSGNITLLADDDNALTIGTGGQVASVSGNVRLTGGQVSYPAGSVLAAPGKLTVVSATPGNPQQPEPQQPEPQQPEPQQPEPQQPEPQQPEPQQPEPQQPEPQQPEPQQPEPQQPEPQQPEPQQPEPQPPEPQQPEPQQPEPQQPSLNACLVNPSTPGCDQVLPKPDFCSTHPRDARCLVFNPAPAQSGDASKKPLAQAQQTTLNLINTRTPAQEKLPAAGASGGDGGAGEGAKPAEQSENRPGPAADTNTGAKNEKPATKMYCN